MEEWVHLLAPLRPELADGDVLAEAFGLLDGVGLELPGSSFAPAAWPVPADLLADALGLGEDRAPALAFGLADAVPGDGDVLGLAAGVGASAVGRPGATSSTWRKRSTAELSSGRMSSALRCGTETTISSVPCCWILAPVNP